MAVEEPSFLKVKLRSSLGGGSQVTFQVSPDVVENRAVNYKALDPVHMPGQIHVYQNSASRTFALNGIKFISRTSEEATKNLWAINILRHWTVPYFGIRSGTVRDKQRNNRKTGQSEFDTVPGTEDRSKLFDGRELLGAPPDVLYLSAYSEVGRRGNIHKVPVVITNLSIPYPSDVDYMPTATDPGTTIGHKYRHVDAGVPFPTVMSFDINLTETHSPREYSNFSIWDYRKGKLENF